MIQFTATDIWHASQTPWMILSLSALSEAHSSKRTAKCPKLTVLEVFGVWTRGNLLAFVLPILRLKVIAQIYKQCSWLSEMSAAIHLSHKTDWCKLWKEALCIMPGLPNHLVAVGKPWFRCCSSQGFYSLKGPILWKTCFLWWAGPPWAYQLPEWGKQTSPALSLQPTNLTGKIALLQAVQLSSCCYITKESFP